VILCMAHAGGVHHASYALQLAEFTGIRVKKRKRTNLSAGDIYICPGGQHLRVSARGACNWRGNGEN